MTIFVCNVPTIFSQTIIIGSDIKFPARTACCVVTKLEGEFYQSVTLVSLLRIDRDGIIVKQCGLA